MIGISPKWLFEKMGIQADEEITELVTLFIMRYTSAPDRLKFLKECLKKALGQAG